jgi:fumarate hydratase class I
MSRRDFLKSATAGAVSVAVGAVASQEALAAGAPQAKPPVEPQFDTLFKLGPDKTPYRLLTDKYVSVIKIEGQPALKIDPKGLAFLASEAMRDVNFLQRPGHLGQVAAILQDDAASPNDKSVAFALLRNAEVASKFELPLCQDTGTATIFAKKGQQVWTGANDEALLAQGIYQTYNKENLRYSQTVGLDTYNEINTGNNLPAQIDIYATEGMDYNFLFVAKGGGSANKMVLFQESKAILNPGGLEKYLISKMKTLGTAACPPYHMAFVVGGTSSEQCMKTLKLATAKYLDELPTQGDKYGSAFRDTALEKTMLEAAYKSGYGAQFGGKYFALDVRVIRLPRHGASCPVGMGVSCAGDRNVKAKINKDGIWLEALERNPGRFIPIVNRTQPASTGVKFNVDRPMAEVLADLNNYPVGTQLLLNGTLIVARDIAHAKFKERLDKGLPIPEYLTRHPVYYAGPAKQPKDKPSGSFGPTTAGRMDSYVDLLQSKGGSMVMIAKGNRSQQVTDACQKFGGFYLGSMGGPAALLAEENIKKVECLDYAELGMEAVWKIDVVDFPAFVLVDNKGNDLYKKVAS